MDNNNDGFSMKQGYLWFVDGWHIFKQQPVLFIIGPAIVPVRLGIEVLLYGKCYATEGGLNFGY